VDLCQHIRQNHDDAPPPTRRHEGCFTNTFVIYTKIAYAKHLCRRVFGKRGFTIIFTHYNGSRAFVNAFGINTHDDLPSLPSLRCYVKSFGPKVYYTFINHFDSRGSLITSVRTFISTTMTTLTTPNATEDSVTSAS
jgi:hypothetical protein